MLKWIKEHYHYIFIFEVHVWEEAFCDLAIPIGLIIIACIVLAFVTGAI